MTERLYYTDSYQQEFDATVVAIHNVGQRPALQLDQTYFYPTSGGQAFDQGVLAGTEVVDVIVDPAGNIQHILAALPVDVTIDDQVHGAIAWERRYDHMQQHSGQHLLSQVFYQAYGAETVSVHFGTIESTLDLDVREVSGEQLVDTERQVNDLVYAGLPIHAYLVDERKLATIPLRRSPKVQGQIRIVEIDAFDYSACGGTHCHTTAELGPIKLLKAERRRDQTRVTFLCGKRAYADYATKHQLLMTAAALYDNEVRQVPSLIERNLVQLKESERTISELRTVLSRYEAQELLQDVQRIGPARVVREIFQDRDIRVVKDLANHLQAQPDVVALLAAVDGEKCTLCFACTPTLPLHVGQILRNSLDSVGGKGGGKADFAQGGGVASVKAATVLDLAEQLVRDSLGGL